MDLVGGARNALMRPSGHLHECATERGRRVNAHADFVGDEDRVKPSLFESADDAVHLLEDALHRILAHQEVAEPVGQAVDDHDVASLERPERAFQVERLFDGGERVSPVTAVTVDSTLHLVIRLSGGRDESPALAELLGELDGERALARSDPSPD
jgi:hypothetical protein